MESKTSQVLFIVAIIATAGIVSFALVTMLSPLELTIKDAPYDDLVSINVDISAVEIHRTDLARWISLMNGNENRLNCSIDGTEETISRPNMGAGTYDIIRIKFNHIRLRYNNDSLYEVDKYESQNTVQNFWLEIPINFVYDGAGGKILFDITINDNSEAVVTIIQTSA